jgi:putative FmdB family regulatory protein
MPIYAYRCSNCGHAQDVLQKMSDAVLTVCPACGESTYVKQVTAAGFQLKGSGWYVTDFRGDNKTAKSAEAGADASKSGDAPSEKKAGESESKGESKGDAKSGDAKKATENAPASSPAPAPAAAPAAASPAPAAAPSSPKKTGS